MSWQELADGRADKRRPAHAPTDNDFKAQGPVPGAAHHQANVMGLGHRPVLRRRRNGDLELTRQEREFRMQAGPLAYGL